MNPETMRVLESSRLAKFFILVLLFLALFLLAQTINAFKEYRYIGGAVPSSNTITVSGEGEVFAVPDIATFSFSVIEEKKTAQEAQEVSTKKVNDILAYVRSQGIEERDIKTLNYNLYPKYDYMRAACSPGAICTDGKQVLRGFEVNQTIEIKARDTEGAGTLVSGVGERGASNVSGLMFTIDDEDALKRQARQDAIDDARTKAQELAKDLGVKMVRIVSFTEGGVGIPLMYRAETMARDSAAGDMGTAPAPELPTGENKITSNVTIMYEIR